MNYTTTGGEAEPLLNIHRTIYCEECNKEIDIEEMADGTLIVHCPNCIGECVSCSCHLAKTCFTEKERVLIRHPEDGRKLKS